MNYQHVKEQLDIVNHDDVWSIVRKIAGNVHQDESFYVCNLNDVVEKHRRWRSLLPRIKPYYAVKCNDSRGVLEVLAALGTGFDCASKSEIKTLLSLGVNKNRIIYANPAKAASHITYAASVGVSLMTFDSKCELYKLQNLYPDCRLILRIRSDATDSDYNLGNKFGCDPILEAPKLLHVAKSLNLDVIGVSFHVGSGCNEPRAYHRAIAATRDVFDYAESIGFSFTILDIGGGFPGVYGSYMEEIGSIINDALDQYFSDPSVTVISEPGQYYVGSAFTLACNIHTIKETTIEADQPNTFKNHHMYYITDGAYGNLRERLEPPVPLQRFSGTKLIPASKKLCSSSVWGPTCDGTDLVYKDILLPKMQVGDWFVFETMGAYKLALACQFNGFPFPQIRYIITESLWSQLKDVLSLTVPKLKMRRSSLQDHLRRHSIHFFDNSTTLFNSQCEDQSDNENRSLKYIDIASIKE